MSFRSPSDSREIYGGIKGKCGNVKTKCGNKSINESKADHYDDEMAVLVLFRVNKAI